MRRSLSFLALSAGLLVVFAGCKNGLVPDLGGLQDGLARIVGTLSPGSGRSLSALADATIGIVGQPAKRLGDYLDPDTGRLSYDVDLGVPGAYDSLDANPEFDPAEYQLVIYDNGTGLGVKLDGLSLQSGAEKTLSAALELQPTGSITGTIALSDARSPLGATVAIPGTGLAATADAAGNFTLSGVPAGTYEMLRCTTDGYFAGTVSNIELAPAGTTNVGTLTLILSTGPDGSILIENGSPFTSSLEVTVTVGTSADAVLMRISESEAFTGASWRPLQYSSTYQFTAGGLKRLYLSLADANGLATSIGYDEITISTDPAGTFPQSPTGTTSSLRPTFAWTALAEAGTIPDEVYDLQVSANPSFSPLLIDQAGLTALSYTPGTVLLPADGSYYWRVRARIPSDGLIGAWYDSGFTLDAAPQSLAPSGSEATLQPALTWSQPFSGATYSVEITSFGDGNFASASSYPGAASLSGETYDLSAQSKALSDGSYRFRVRSMSGSAYTSAWVEQTFTVAAAPTALSSAAATNDTTPSLSWTPAYPGGQIELEVDNSAGFGSPEASTTTAANASGFTTSALSLGSYFWRARTSVTIGMATFTSAWATGSSFTIEQTAPTGSFTINGGAATTNELGVTLTLSALDANGVASARSANSSGGLASVGYTAYSGSLSHSLTSGDGAKTVYVQFKDNAGNESPAESISASITLEYGIVYVSATGNDSNPGIRTAPKATLPAGISLANSISSTGQVRVAAGTYNIGSSTLSLTGGVSLMGGYSSSDWNTRNSAIYVSEIAFTDSAGGYGGGQAAVALGGTASLSGFTVTATYPNASGGWVSTIRVDDSTPTINGNTIAGTAPGSSPRVVNVAGGSPLFANNIVLAYGDSPSAVYAGGGSTPFIYNNLLVMVMNTGFSSMGIMMDGSSKSTVVNNVFHGFTYVGWEQAIQADALVFSNNNAYGFGTFYFNKDNNSSNDITATQALGDMTAANNLSVDLTTANYLVDFDGPDNNLSTYAGNDWHWGSSAPVSVREGGQNLSGSFTTDKDGTTRSAPWSVGPYE